MKKLITLGTCLFIASSSYAGFYRWVDESGEVHFSDKVPVAVSKKAHTEIDKHGITRKSIDPEASLKELEEASQLELEQQERERLAKIKHAELAKIQKRDEYLLSTYDNENEISAYFETKIKMIKGNSSILTIQNSKLAKKVAKLEQKINVNKDKNTKKSLEKRIVDINQTIKQYDQALLDNDKEIIKLSKAYKIDYKRYTELNQ